MATLRPGNERLDALERELDRRGRVEQPLRERLAEASTSSVRTDELLSLLVASVKDYALFVLDATGHVATWNAGAERIKGYTADEIIGRHFSTFYPEEDVLAGKCELELEIAAREGRFEDEGWRLRKDGSRFWANVVISPMHDGRGQLVGFSKVTRDLTERKRNEDDRAARLAAEEANRAKDEFLAVLGHELRNPLAPIVTALEVIKLRGDRRSEREHQVIERQVQHMMRLVDDLLDVSRIASGKIELTRAPIDLHEVIALAAEVASPLIDQKGHRFGVTTTDAPLPVHGDMARLTQVFTNLLTNAAKYTDPGGHITVDVRHTGRDIVVEIRDDGIGMAPDLLARVFDVGVQGPQRSDRASGGLGLGLPLVRSLVTLHGGRVEARSDGPQRGSTFTVHLPALAHAEWTDATERLAQALPATSHTWRILLVDDNEDARTLLAEVLTLMGHEVREAGDGPQALAVARELVPDLAILDIGLPEMDGYELAQRLRALPQATGLHLLALSGYGTAADQERSRAAGFARHIVKPVDVRGLIEAITELAPRSAAQGQSDGRSR